MRKWWANDNITTLVITATATRIDKPVSATPKAVPDAGGCPVSVATMAKVVRPTASEYTRIECKVESWGIKAHREPKSRPSKWPPITFRGLAVILWGMAKTIKVVAPIDAITTACSIFKNTSMMNTVRVASKL